MYTARQYVKVSDLEEAYELNQKRANKILGGTLWMRMGTKSIGTAIDMSGLGLDKIEENETEFKIGAMVTLRAVETNAALDSYFHGAWKECLRHIVGVQFRNCATMGGSVYSRFGFSDILTLLMALDSYVEMYKGGIIPISEFADMKYDNDILVSIIIKKTTGKVSYKSHRNTKTDFPVIACAAANWGDKIVRSVGARPAKAVIVEKADDAAYGTNMRAGADYRRHLANVLLDEAVKEVQ
jgi:CO/xanthine dehydrogenase FAD-binding subunit